KDAKIYLFLPFLPLAPLFTTNFTSSIDFNRTRNESRQRQYNFNDPTGRQFRANRGFGFNWKFIENWIIDIGGTYNFKVGSDLTQYETNNDSLRTQKTESEIFRDIFLNNGLLNFGKDLDYQQSTSINPKFNIPVIKKFLDITASYNVSYGWTNPNTTVNIGYNVGYANTINAGANIKFGDLLGLFGNKGATTPPPKLRSDLGSGKLTSSGSVKFDDGKPGIGDIIKIIGTFIPDNINMNFNQTNAVTNPGVQGRPGFGNFWMSPTTKEEYGPSRLYQLGLSMYPGKRIPGLSITDGFNQNNNITISATIQPILPQSIKMNLTFKNNWGFNNTTTYISSPDGNLFDPTNKSSSRSKGYSMFFAGDVTKFRFQPSDDPALNIKTFSESFKKDIGAIAFPNWNLTVSGLETFPLFSEFATSVTLENSFTSEYSESSQLDISQNLVPSRQSVTQSFNPLIGLNINFKPAFGGTLTATMRINNSKSNILVPSSNMIQTTSTKDWSFNANFAKSGFEIPLFGLSLKNDITFALTISQNSNDPIDYRFNPGSDLPDPLNGNGSKVTTVNPSIQYSLSSKVQMQVFFKYIKTEPTGTSYSTIPRTSSEGGLNVRVSLQ
ncbi:hypothetical protein D4R20_01750, partial [bacterium]